MKCAAESKSLDSRSYRGGIFNDPQITQQELRGCLHIILNQERLTYIGGGWFMILAILRREKRR
jgi:hypothetical protein